MLTWTVLLALALLSATTYALARRRAVATAGGKRASLHSLPGYYGTYVALWTGVPAFLLLALFLLIGPRLESVALHAQMPAAAEALPSAQRELLIEDARAIANGRQASEAVYEGPLRAALETQAAEARRVGAAVRLGSLALIAVLAVLGFLYAYSRIRPTFRARNGVEGWIRNLLVACSAVAVFTTLGILLSLLVESWRFFSAVSPFEFLFGTRWSPHTALRADQVGASGAFGAVPLFVGTFLITAIAMLVAGPVGLFSAIYLSEYAGSRTAAWVKPMMEVSRACRPSSTASSPPSASVPPSAAASTGSASR
jgi:phosphate transport system permease protein